MLDTIVTESNDDFKFQQIYGTSSFLKSISNNHNNSTNDRNSNDSRNMNDEDSKGNEMNSFDFDFDKFSKMNDELLKKEYILEKSYLFVVEQIFSLCLDFDEFIDLLLSSKKEIDKGSNSSNNNKNSMDGKMNDSDSNSNSDSDIDDDNSDDSDIDIETRNQMKSKSKHNKRKMKKTSKRTESDVMDNLEYCYNGELFWESILSLINDILIHFIKNEKWWYLSRVYQTFHDLLQSDPSLVVCFVQG